MLEMKRKSNHVCRLLFISIVFANRNVPKYNNLVCIYESPTANN